MNQLRLIALIALLLSLSGCSAITVNQDYNPDYNFQTLQTYGWFDDNKTVSSDARINNDLIKDRIVKAIESSLHAKGYTKVPNAEASFLVTWHGTIDSKLQVNTIDHYYIPYGYSGRGAYYTFMDSGARHTIISEYDVGTLLIDILDPIKHKLVWRGTGQGIVHANRTPEEITEEINNAVSAIFTQFPPTPKKSGQQ